MEGPDRTKETRTAEELERIILEDLRNMDGRPKRGVSVTVYGIPWNAILIFGAEAGPVRNQQKANRRHSMSGALPDRRGADFLKPFGCSVLPATLAPRFLTLAVTEPADHHRC
jgi:hypothetical protein